MKRFALIGMALAAVAAGLVGCEWNTGEDASSWSSAYDWVNFSGVYRGSTTIPLDPDYVPGVTNVYGESESNWTMPIRGTRRSGVVSHGNIVPGSVTVSCNGANLSDSQSNGILTGNGSGTINYASGAWSIEIDAAYADYDKENPIAVSYAYQVVTDESGSEFSTSEVDAYSFNVDHNGQYLTLVDNVGAAYTGRIKKMQSSSGAQNTDIEQVAGDEESQGAHAKITYYESELPANGDLVVASFEVSGSGGKIVGTLSGLVNQGVITERLLDGTKITAGSTDDIYAFAPAVTITFVSTSSGTNTTEGTETSTSTSTSTASTN